MEIFGVRYRALLLFVGVPCLLLLVVVLFDGVAPAGRGGEGSCRLELGCCGWLAWALPRRREEGWFGVAGVVAVYVHRARSSSRGGGRFCGLLHLVEVLSPSSMAVRRRRWRVGVWGVGWI